MTWQSYQLDRKAQKLVLNYRDDKDVLNQAHKMRMTAPYGLERFWGERLRLSRERNNKAKYWGDTWQAFVEIMAVAGVAIPNDSVGERETTKVQAMATKLWALPLEDQKVALAVLTQFCDCLVWWTQRYKP
ncbi:hypothetical protein [Anthocerotibacter panamensis]|uniref:hypothetical protein n=1 Tax=Anthocerotibacter panamensis TaxID=2857077 RepID=UPI001C402E7C|nr:hypothetical protein [Anthocerotibacter panamensis]